MRDFRGDETLAFTEEEADAIRRAEVWGQPMAVRARPWRRFFVGTVACTLIAWFIMSLVHLLVRESPAPAHTFLTVAVVRRAVHLRERPSVQARSLGVLPAGTLVTVEERRTDGFDRILWTNVRGYSAGAYLAVSDGVELLRPSATRIGQIQGNARLREQGSVAAASVGGLGAGTPVTVLGLTRSGWSLVSAGTRTGFVWGGLLDDQPSLPFRPHQEGGERVVSMNGAVLRP